MVKCKTRAFNLKTMAVWIGLFSSCVSAMAADMRILSITEIPSISQNIEKQYFNPSISKSNASTKDELLSMLRDMRDLGVTAQDSIIGNLDTLQTSKKLAQQAIKKLAAQGITEDSITLRLVEVSGQEVAAGISGVELIETTFELNGYLVSMKSPDLLRKANLLIAESFSKAGNRKVAIQYLRQVFAKDAGKLDADNIKHMTTNLAGVIVEGDIAVLRAFVLSTANLDERESYLRQVGQNAQRSADAEGTHFYRISRLNDFFSAGDDQNTLSTIISSAVDKGEDDFAAILSQANAKLSDLLIAEVIERRLSEGYDLRARRLLPFLTDVNKTEIFSQRIAQSMADAGYLKMANALVRDSAKKKDHEPTPFQLPSEVLTLAKKEDYPSAIARILRLPASVRPDALSELAMLRVGSGDLKGALNMVRSIPDFSSRLAAFRRIAQSRAASLDSYGLLGMSAARSEVKPQIRNAQNEFPQILGVDFNWKPSPNQMEVRPRFQIPVATAQTVRAEVPPIAPGAASMILARFNKRVGLSGASTTDDIGIFGANIREYLFEAQGSVVPAILMVDSGVHTLTDLIQTASEIGQDAIVAEGDAFKISIPIFVRPGATLVLSGLEAREYRLDTSSGAFIMNSGTLIISDTTLLAYDYKKNAPDFRTADQQQSFRPFVTSWSGSRTDIAHAELKNLGYFGGRSYGFTMVSDPAYIRDRRSNTNKPTGTIVDSTFDNLLYGFYSYEAEDVVIIGNEYRDNIIYGLDPHDRSQRLVMAYNTAYGSVEKHGGIISREVDDSLIVGNLAFSNKGAGLMVERNSIGNIIYANTSFENGGDGIAIYESPCNLVESNDSFSNGNAGVKVRNSWDVLVRSNRLENNRGAGLEAAIADVTSVNADKERDLVSDPFFTYVELDARRNEISRNRAGIAVKGASRITLEANILRTQMPDTFSGDLKAYRAQLLRPDLGRVEATATCLPPKPPGRKCSLESSGLLTAQIQPQAATEDAEKYCTESTGSLQQKALIANKAELTTK